MKAQFDEGRGVLLTGLELAGRVVELTENGETGTPEWDELCGTYLMWLAETPLEIGVPTLRLIVREGGASMSAVFQSVDERALVAVVIEKYAPLLQWLLERKAQLEEAMQHVMEHAHDCENCELRDVCPDSTYKSEDGGNVIEGEAVEVGNDDVEDPREIDLTTFTGTKH